MVLNMLSGEQILRVATVHADVSGWTAGVTAELECRNNMHKPMERQLVFPLNDTSAVYRLEADIGGRKLRGECRPRKEAEETYQEAVDSGRTSVLLENQSGSSDVFRIMLGNLPAQGNAKITIGFVEPLRRDPDGSLDLTLPAVLNPRYIPKDMSIDAEKMKEHYHFKVDRNVSHSMSFSAKVNLGVGSSIKEIVVNNSGDTVMVDYENEKQTANVRLAGEFTQDHDFGLTVRPNKPLRPMVYVEPRQQGSREPNWFNYDIACAWFEPEVSNTCQLVASLTLLDSDQGMKRFSEMGKLTLQFFLSPQYIFSVYDRSVNYSESTIQEAVEHSNRLRANLGGTEIFSSLNFIYSQPKPTQPGARKFVILLTDGEVANTSEVIDLARSNAATARVFSIGIGEGASSALINGLARVSGGVSEFVRNSSDCLQAKVLGLMAAATNPAADNVVFKWEIYGGKVVSKMPEQVPTAVFNTLPVKQYVVIKRLPGKDVEGNARLTAQVDDGMVDHKLPILIPCSVHSEREDSMPLHRLAAKARLQELTDNLINGNMDDLRTILVSISTFTSVSCQETAFVAVDLKSNNVVKVSNIGKPPYFDIKRPSSYGFLGGHCMAATPGCNMKGLSNRAPLFGSRRKRSFNPRRAGDVMIELLRLQKFDGSWLCSDIVARSAVSLNETEMRERATSVLPANISDVSLATLVVVAVLRHIYPDRIGEWQMVERKAISYLKVKLGLDNAKLEGLIQAVATAFTLDV